MGHDDETFNDVIPRDNRPAVRPSKSGHFTHQIEAYLNSFRRSSLQAAIREAIASMDANQVSPTENAMVLSKKLDAIADDIKRMSAGVRDRNRHGAR